MINKMADRGGESGGPGTRSCDAPRPQLAPPRFKERAVVPGEGEEETAKETACDECSRTSGDHCIDFRKSTRYP